MSRFRTLISSPITDAEISDAREMTQRVGHDLTTQNALKQLSGFFASLTETSIIENNFLTSLKELWNGMLDEFLEVSKVREIFDIISQQILEIAGRCFDTVFLAEDALHESGRLVCAHIILKTMEIENQMLEGDDTEIALRLRENATRQVEDQSAACKGYFAASFPGADYNLNHHLDEANSLHSIIAGSFLRSASVLNAAYNPVEAMGEVVHADGVDLA